MKGIAHFAVGVAVASCFPQAVAAGADGNPLPFVLGGVFGLLPDTLDFKFLRFFHRHHLEVTPDPKAPDPRMIADAVAFAVNRACATQQPVRIKLNTIRLGADLWRQYQVRFDVPDRRVVVRLGPVVDTGGAPAPGGADDGPQEAAAPLACGLKLDYRATTVIDAFEGPLFTMEPAPGGEVMPRFIAWHRQWSHSLIAAAAWGLIAALLSEPYLGLIVTGAYSAHALLDHLGFMGSNLLFPFRKHRDAGMQVTRSDSAPGNFMTVWTSCILVFWNLYHGLPWTAPGWNLLSVFCWGLAVPAGIGLAVRRAVRRGGRPGLDHPG